MSRWRASGKPGERPRLPVRPSRRQRASGYIKSLPCFPDPSRWTLCDTVTLDPDWGRVTEEIVKTNLVVRVTAMILFVALQFRVHGEIAQQSTSVGAPYTPPRRCQLCTSSDTYDAQ
jgi:hypothetical protein